MPKAPEEIADIKRLPPVRRIAKQEAIRHLIHAAIRMIAAHEDPFAIHMLVQSADKLLIDVSKRTAKTLAHDWTDLIKPEYRKPLMQTFRETYNYFKHADSDHDETLHVGDIAETNVLQLAVCIVNYHAVLGEITDHMKLLFTCAKVVLPAGFVDEASRPFFEEQIRSIPGFASMRFGDFFNSDLWRDELLRAGFPNLLREREQDLQDNERFFGTRIGDFPVRR